jgi:cysteinyl-tRNA synthetase
MSLHLYNTLTRQKEEFVPLHPGKVGMYACGPTVYDRAHIGNARPVVVIDTLFRLLQMAYEVTYVRNITDIDDKIITASHVQQKPIDEITEETTRYYHQDMAALGALSPTYEPRATAYVDQMITFNKRLIEQGYAYEAEGHVLFEVSKQPHYGCLSRCQQDEMLAGARVEVAPYKKHPADFVLWKPSSDDMPGWNSPWGRGRPGWHIECSAMSQQLLGESFDIHAGGQDLIFPHHENEIAQSTAAFGEGTFARTWLHIGILTVNGEKMSKSLGNFMTVEELLHKADGETIRFAILSTHYRQQLDWTEETLIQAKNNLDRFYLALRDAPMDVSDSKAIDNIVLEALEDDLNTPAAIARLHELTHGINTAKDAKQRRALQLSLRHSAALMGLLQKSADEWLQAVRLGQEYTVQEIEALIAARQQARKNKDFIQADAIRQQLLGKGIILEDNPQGTQWRRV